MAIDRVGGSISLAHRVMRQSISVVLFVAAWSYESFPISRQFARVTEELNCSDAVSLVEFDVPIGEVNPLRPRAPFFSLPWLGARESVPRKVAYNLTAGIPWFPALRVFRVGDGRVRFHGTYEGTFDARALRAFLKPVCEGRLPGDGRRTGREVAPAALSEVVYGQTPAAGKGVLVFADRGKVWNASAAWEDAIGLHAEVAAYREQCTHSAPFGKGADEGPREWFVSAFEKGEYMTLMERYGVDPRAPETSTVLLDAQLDKVHVLHNAHTFLPESAAQELAAFDEQGAGIWRVSGRAQTDRSEHGVYLGSAPEWLVECSKSGVFVPIECVYDPARCTLRNTAALSNFSSVQKNSTVWVAFLETSCGYCQEIIPTLIAFARRARKEGVDARVFAALEATSIPAVVGRIVDGFPTVVVARGKDGGKGVSEYVGGFDVDAMLKVARADA